jgi:predicted PurR-regulated permease PerM
MFKSKEHEDDGAASQLKKRHRCERISGVLYIITCSLLILSVVFYALNPFGIGEFLSDFLQSAYDFLYSYFITSNEDNHNRFEQDPINEMGDVEFLEGTPSHSTLVNFLN